MSSHSARRFDRLAVVLGLALWALAGRCIAFDAASPVRAYYYFLHWTSVGDADQAVAQFADDAVVVAGPACTPAQPCIGKAAIRARYILPLIAGQAVLPVNGARFDGLRLHTSSGAHTFEFGHGRITTVRAVVDYAPGDVPEAPSAALQQAGATRRELLTR